MKKLVAAGVMTWLCHMATASAGVPDWCKDASFKKDSYDLKDLSSKDVGDVIETFAGAICMPSAEAEANKADIEKARQAWGKKLGMNDADWADAVAYANVDGRPENPRLSTKDIASFTAMDQYVVIKDGFQGTSSFSNPVYLTDMLEPNLTEVGRLAYLLRCSSSSRLDSADSAVPFAICQGDIDAFDAAKFAVQLRGDTAHPGETKMKLRFLAYGLPARLKDHAANVAAIFAKDEAYKKLWEAAKKGRAEWASLFSSNTALLALATRMDTYFFTKSRKAFDGCAETTTAALHAAITAKVAAKLFKDKKDIRRDPYEGVAKGVGPAMLDIPEIAFVAGPYIICHDSTGTAEFLSYWIDNVPGQRGPRAAAFTEITKAKVVLDDMSASISYSTSWNHPFARSHGSLASTGAVVKSVKVVDDALEVESEVIPVKVNTCMSSRRTNRISRINYDGRIEYETLCDKWGVVTHNDAWGAFKIHKRYQKFLKKGVLFSSVGGANDKAADILAVWSKKDAALPTMVLGAPVK